MKKYRNWVLVLSLFAFYFMILCKLITGRPSNNVAITFVMICGILIIISYYENEKE